MDSGNLGKWIAIAGLLLVAVGGIVWAVGRLGIPLGSLPGDIRIEGKRSTVYVPIMTGIVVSIVLTIVLNVIARLWR